MNKFETKIMAVGMTFVMATSFVGCDRLQAIDNKPTITDVVPSPTEIPPTPTLIPTLEPEPPTPTIAPTPTEIPPTPTSEKRANPSLIIKRGNPNKPEIAFTFDDNGEGLHNILNICNEKGIKATFFLLAGELSASPAIWQQAIKDGHQICNHGVSHNMSLGKLSEEEIKNDILGWEKVCKAVLGEDYFNRMKKDFPYARSPGGNTTPLQQQVLGDLGYSITVYWSAEDCWSMEAAQNPNKLTLAQYFINRVKNGDIFLTHGPHSGEVTKTIDGCKAKGYSFKLVSEILD